MRVYSQRVIVLTSIGRVAVIAFFLTIFLPSLFPVPAWTEEEHRLKVALFVDRGASAPAKSNFSRELANSPNILWRMVEGSDIRNGDLKDFDAILVPGGSAKKESESMGVEAREEVRRFVDNGGIYMGVCAGAYLASQAKESDLGLLPLTTLDQKHWFRVSDGTLVDVELTPIGKEVFGIPQRNIRIIYENGPIFAPVRRDHVDENVIPLGFYRSEVVADGGEPGVMLGAPAMILSRYGKGIVLAISPHPEKTEGMDRVAMHALQWLYEHRGVPLKAAAITGITSQSRKAGGNREISETRSESRISQSGVNSVGRSPGKIKTANEPSGERTASAEPYNQSVQDSAQAVNSELSEKAIKLAESIFDRASVVSYFHKEVPASKQVITTDDGTVEARTDCSGFISYITRTIAPRHYEAVRSREPGWSYPQAKIWARFFDTLGSDRPRDGWLGISDWRNLRPGDFIAWAIDKSESKVGGNTGHVMMVIDKPSVPRIQDGYRFIEVRVIDSSSIYHFAPEQLPPNAHQHHRDGLGTGCVRIILSDADAPIGYWEGTYSGEHHKEVRQPKLSRMVRFARMVPLHDG